MSSDNRDTAAMAGPALLEHLLGGNDLTETQAADLLRAMAGASMAPALAGATLAALRAKGETPAEIRGFATAMRALARRPEIPPGQRAVDIVGTGGDNSHSLNLSTGAALLAAAAGVPVVKHGNRSVSSRSGSADVLAALGLPMPLAEHEAGQALAEIGFTFLFAPHYHPAMKEIAPVRAALGVRTVFNILGPLTNPAAPPYMVIGAFSEGAAVLMAEALVGMPIRHALVLHGAGGWDEATPVGPFVRFDVKDGHVRREARDPVDYGVQRCSLDDLRGGDAEHNAARLRAALKGGDTQAHRDALILTAALALEVTGMEPDPRAAGERAREAIASGAAGTLVDRLATVAG